VVSALDQVQRVQASSPKVTVVFEITEDGSTVRPIDQVSCV